MLSLIKYTLLFLSVAARVTLAADDVVAPPASKIGCLDEQGNSVDWFVIYKMPTISDFSEGYNYMYTDSTTNAPLALSNNQLDQEKGAIAKTLAQLYDAYDNKRSDEIGWALYNDEPPHRKAPTKFGHSKGALGFDKDTGFWLVHSIPRWPQIISSKRRYSFPEDERLYGQTALCVSTDFKTMDVIAHEYFMYSRPNIYSSSNPFPEQMPAFNSIITDATHLMTHVSNVAKIKSLAGETFLTVAKTANWGRSLYADAVAPLLKDDLLVETWQRPHLESYCDLKKLNITHTLEDVTEVSFPAAGFVFTETKDHAKWCVTKKEHFVCIGDINHNKSQYHRAGGTVCVKNAQLWKSFTAAATGVEYCKKK